MEGLDSDAKFMKEALSLARSAEGRTSPDPMVGAVIVKDGQIISTGYHAEVATPHAEAWAIQKAQAQGKAQGSTLYVTLEPCCFFEEKKNPPCTQLIINAGIKKVIAAMEDPNPSVAGRGFAELREAGIEVEIGLMEEEAKKLNEVFIKHITTGRPYVILKSAMSLDGKIATKKGESFWITGIEARKAGHRLRNVVDAVMVGIGTIIKDDPTLNVRDIEGIIKNPKKIILDPHGKIPLNCKALRSDPSNTIVVVSSKASEQKIKMIKAAKAEVLAIKTNKSGFAMDLLLKELGKRKIASILIEGGGDSNAAALSAGIVDKVFFFYAPKIIGGKLAPTSVEGEGISLMSQAIKLKELEIKRLGEDILVSGYIIK